MREDSACIKANIKAAMEDVCEDIRTSLSRQTEVKFNCLKTDLEAATRTQVGTMGNELKSALHAQESKMADFQRSSQTEITTVRSDLTRVWEHLGSKADRLQEFVEAKTQLIVEAVREQPRKQPSLGEAGFFGQQCPAPSRWNQGECET